MKQKVYCNYCGKALGSCVLEGKVRQICNNCKTVYYENPLPVASVIVANKEREVLLVKRAREPFAGTWCFPIGFAETGESIEDAALRELKEEAGITGAIIQLIDVSSHTNPLYGELLIVSFEAQKMAGDEIAGDDASECQYFPITNLPRLAFDSQKRAIQKFKELKKDLWSIHDSFESFVEGTIEDKAVYPVKLLSDEFIEAVEGNSLKIVNLWLDDILTNPSTLSYHTLDRAHLFAKATLLVENFACWLKGQKNEDFFRSFYCDLGKERKEDGVMLQDIISSFSLLKKHLWMFTYSFGVWEKTVDIYRIFELGERLVRFFDKAIYHTATGYMAKSSSPSDLTE